MALEVTLEVFPTMTVPLSMWTLAMSKAVREGRDIEAKINKTVADSRKKIPGMQKVLETMIASVCNGGRNVVE